MSYDGCNKCPHVTALHCQAADKVWSHCWVVFKKSVTKIFVGPMDRLGDFT